MANWVPALITEYGTVLRQLAVVSLGAIKIFLYTSPISQKIPRN
jgi:hypothetical protein